MFGDKLKEIRVQRGFTQRQLAKAIHVDAPMYSRYEHGERRMKREMVSKLAEYYNMPEEELIKFWLADRVYSILSDEESAKDALNIVAETFPNYGNNL